MLYELLTIIHLQWITLHARWNEWILQNTSMPRADYGMAIASYNQSIFLMGGAYWKKQFTQYKIPENTFIDHGHTYFHNPISGDSPFYTQSADILYIYDDQNSALDIFNLQNKELTASVLTFPTEHHSSCLASTADFLFVVGGVTWSSDDAVGTVQMLRLNTLDSPQWHNFPPLTEPRAYHSCIIDPSTNILYAIGGDDFVQILSSIEYINTNDITPSRTWEYMDPLIIAIAYTRAVIHHNIIYILGGATVDISTWTYYDTVQLIDISANQVSISADPLLYAMSDVTPIIMNDVLYVFGGYDEQDSVLDTLMTYQLPSTPTTDEPTTGAPITTDNPLISSTILISTTVGHPPEPQTTSINIVMTSTDTITSNPSEGSTVSQITEHTATVTATAITEDTIASTPISSSELVGRSTTSDESEKAGVYDDNDNSNSNSFEIGSFATSINGILAMIAIVLMVFLCIAIGALCVIKRTDKLQKDTQHLHDAVAVNAPKSSPIEMVSKPADTMGNNALFEGNDHDKQDIDSERDDIFKTEHVTMGGPDIVDDYKQDVDDNKDGDDIIAMDEYSDDDVLTTGIMTMGAPTVRIVSAVSDDNDSDDDVLIGGHVTRRAPAIVEDDDDEYVPPPPPPPPPPPTETYT